jgi:flagellar biosynthesis/type III secretory pathway ATPase
MDVTRVGDKCIVKQEKSSKTVEAEVLSFNEKRNLTVVLNKSVKLMMTWNGRMYEGRMAGIDFITDGPSVIKTKTGVRG